LPVWCFLDFEAMVGCFAVASSVEKVSELSSTPIDVFWLISSKNTEAFLPSKSMKTLIEIDQSIAQILVFYVFSQ
jgi:hypothetical protein